MKQLYEYKWIVKICEFRDKYYWNARTLDVEGDEMWGAQASKCFIRIGNCRNHWERFAKMNKIDNYKLTIDEEYYG